MSENKKLTPKIRFKGFTEDWEQRKAKEICSISTGKSNTQDQAEDGKYPFYIRSDKPVKSNRYLYDEEAVITIGDGNIGKVFHYVKGKFDLHQRCYKMDNFNDVEGKYFYYFFSTKFYERAMSMTAKATVDSVRLEMISDMDIKYPSQMAEQTKISSILTNLDNLITLHQRKYDKLVKIKSSLLEKMFPKNSSKIPEVRFKGFTEDWEQRKVEELFKITRGYVLSATLTSESKDNKNKYPVYSSQTQNNGLMGYYNDYLYDTAITWTTDGANAGTVRFRPGKFYCTNVCGVLLSDKGYANKMMGEALNNIAKKYVSYVGNPKLMNNVMAEIPLNYPNNLNEQNQISNLFQNIDNLITLHQRKFL